MDNFSPDNHRFGSWKPQKAAADWILQTVDRWCGQAPILARLRSDLLSETGTRLVDWIDHLALPAEDRLSEELDALGFVASSDGDSQTWHHPEALLCRVVLHADTAQRVVIKTDDTTGFSATIERGSPQVPNRDNAAPASVSPRKRLAARENGLELWGIERHGALTWELDDNPVPESAATAALESFLLRQRHSLDEELAYEELSGLVEQVTQNIGTARACDLFFLAERRYWQSRNHAAQVQGQRQDALGLGWGNHDHHTYRSSRAHFWRLISVLEQLGFVRRERFYAGEEAGWGAQVLEHPGGIVIFADVDLAPVEVTGDFAHQPLARGERLGTVGLWCALHGDSMFAAGMHHLECQFDFDAARRQLAALGVDCMDPFTDLPYLKQCFSVGERWQVEPQRCERAAAEGMITNEQAAKFKANGAIGSHLEILERNDGFKGFNQQGVSDIIARTDPRHG